MSTLVALAGVSVHRGRVPVLHDIELTVSAGEVVAVLGPNGAGKSTLLQAIAGGLAPAAGTVRRDGRIATALQSSELARRSVAANVELALAWWGVPRSQRRPRAQAALELLHVGHLSRRPAAQLSGGERRRVHLARALAVSPDVLLLDEPFAGLDVASRAALLQDTAHVLRRTDAATVAVVHDRSEAWALASRLVVLLDGRVAADGAPADLLDDPPSAAVARFLGFTGELLDGDHVVMVRPRHVVLTDGGRFTATVTRRTPAEDTVGLHLVGDAGHAETAVAYPGPEVGTTVRLDVIGGVRFPRATVAP